LKTFSIELLNANQGRAHLPELVSLLQDAVHGGASIGFLSPLEVARAEAYWESVLSEVEQGIRVLLVARQENELHGTGIHGTVQLALATKQNATHRAEVQKLFVHSQHRKRGIGGALLDTVDQEALRHGRHLLFLDTETGSPAERLYRKHGYVAAGEIPEFARSPRGYLHSVLFMYRLLN